MDKCRLENPSVSLDTILRGRRSMIRRVIDWNVRLSAAFDRLLPEEYTLDGNTHFQNEFAPRWIMPGLRVVDVGGGKRPFFLPEIKQRLRLHVTGVDLSEEELFNAPANAYDATVCADIATIVGGNDSDVCICQAVLEHVRDVDRALVAIASCLKPGGIALVFVPSRNAVFARLNLVLPETVKRRALFSIFPQTKKRQGFPSYYNNCTPVQLRTAAAFAGLEVEEARHYYCSKYFSFCAPFHILWRCWLIAFRWVAGESAAETFSLALRKTAIVVSGRQ